jgi:uncharacterized membrane protein
MATRHGGALEASRHALRHLCARPRLLIAAGIGLAAMVLLPGAPRQVTLGLLGWNAATWLYLLLVLAMMLRADHERLRRTALAQAEASVTVLTLVVLAAVVSLVGMVVELSAAKLPGAAHALPHVLFALATVVGSWLLVPTMFALTYASLYYRGTHGVALQFPSADPTYKPDYSDFLYFAFTIAVASQTADFNVSSPAKWRLVLLQSLLSFAFNTAILAFTINIAASMF